jgi:hypothetical protein
MDLRLRRFTYEAYVVQLRSKSQPFDFCCRVVEADVLRLHELVEQAGEDGKLSWIWDERGHFFTAEIHRLPWARPDGNLGAAIACTVVDIGGCRIAVNERRPVPKTQPYQRNHDAEFSSQMTLLFLFDASFL